MCNYFNVAAGKSEDNFYYFIYYSVACEFPYRDQ